MFNKLQFEDTYEQIYGENVTSGATHPGTPKMNGSKIEFLVFLGSLFDLRCLGFVSNAISKGHNKLNPISNFAPNTAGAIIRLTGSG